MERSTNLLGCRPSKFTGHAEYMLDGMAELEEIPTWVHTAIKRFMPGHHLVERAVCLETTEAVRAVRAIADRLFWLTRTHHSWEQIIRSSEDDDLRTLEAITIEASTNLAHARLGKRKLGHLVDFSSMTDDEIVDYAYTGIAIPRLAERMCVTALMLRASSTVKGSSRGSAHDYWTLPKSPHRDLIEDPFDRTASDNRASERSKRRAARRSLNTAERLVGCDVARSLASGREVEIARGEFTYLARVLPTKSGHGAMTLVAADADGRRLAKMCFYIAETPGIDQAVAVSMMVKNGMEEELIKTANLFDRAEGQNPIVDRQLNVRGLERVPKITIDGSGATDRISPKEIEEFRPVARRLIDARIARVTADWKYAFPRIPKSVLGVMLGKPRERASSRLIDLGIEVILRDQLGHLQVAEDVLH
jgi:hypothetical protein